MSDDLDLALDLCDRADVITTAAFGRADLAVDLKADRTHVTEADRAVEDGLRAALAARRPGDAFVGEEGGSSGDGSRRWIVDPVDGTANFVRRVPVWATLLALEVGGTLTVGVVSAPALGRRWWAERGSGAWVAVAGGAPAPIRVSGVGELGEAFLTSCGRDGWDAAGLARLGRLTERCWRDRAYGDFWTHMLVAEGACDIGLDPVVSVWDVAAVQVIVEEAGGRFSDFAGAARADGGSAISTNGLLHDQVLELVGSGGEDR